MVMGQNRAKFRELRSHDTGTGKPRRAEQNQRKRLGTARRRLRNVQIGLGTETLGTKDESSDGTTYVLFDQVKQATDRNVGPFRAIVELVAQLVQGFFESEK